MTTPQLIKVVRKLEWMKERKIWPNGQRYLWTDAFGVVNLLSLYKKLGEEKYLIQAEEVVNNVYKVLGRKKGLRIGEQPDRDGQYYHYLAKWMYALNEFGKIKPEYHCKAVDLVKQIHPHFIVPGRGVIWKMKEDLSGPYPGYGYGGLDFYEGYTVYRLIDETALSSEISDMNNLIQKDFHHFKCTQDLGLGDMLWHCHFFPQEEWSKLIKDRCCKTLNAMWRDKGNDGGYFVRDIKYEPNYILSFGNSGISIGLQAQNMWPERVVKMNKFFDDFKSNDKYDTEAITHVMNCSSNYPGLFLKSNW